MSSAERIAEFLRSSTGRLTVAVEVAAPVGLVWLAGVVPNGRPVRLVLGDGFTRRWAQEPPGETRAATVAFLTAHHIEVRFWRPAPKLGDPSVSVWHAEGHPPKHSTPPHNSNPAASTTTSTRSAPFPAATSATSKDGSARYSPNPNHRRHHCSTASPPATTGSPSASHPASAETPPAGGLGYATPDDTADHTPPAPFSRFRRKPPATAMKPVSNVVYRILAHSLPF